jgi:hypothetical protein
VIWWTDLADEDGSAHEWLVRKLSLGVLGLFLCSKFNDTAHKRRISSAKMYSPASFGLPGGSDQNL